MRLLEEFLQVEKTVHGVGVDLKIDTLRAEDLNTLFPDSEPIAPSEVRIKKGAPLTNYLRLASIEYQEGSKATAAKQPDAIGMRQSTRSVWECPRCHKTWLATETEREAHLKSGCELGAPIVKAKPEVVASAAPGPSFQKPPVDPTRPGVKSNMCETCKKPLTGTPIQILRHRSACRQASGK
jgi:hypothetical protein